MGKDDVLLGLDLDRPGNGRHDDSAFHPGDLLTHVIHRLQRTRETGARVALGPDRRGIVWTVLRRALQLIAFGVSVGATLIVGFTLTARPEIYPGFLPRTPLFLGLGAYLVVMVGVCAISCIVPTVRALAIEPTEALRVEG
jgi:ABC-type antimicrobial peptide transport system permease subunit